MFKLIFLVESNKYLIDQGCHGLTVRYDAEQHIVSVSFPKIFLSSLLEASLS